MSKFKMAVAAVLVAAAALCAVLSGCASAPGSADIGWLTFDVPQGFQIVNESESGVGISVSKDTDVRKNKIAEGTIYVGLRGLEGSQQGAADVIAKLLDGDKQGRYTDAGTFEIAGRTYYVMTFTNPSLDDMPCARGFSDLNDDVVIDFMLFGVSMDDPAAQTVFESLAIDESKLPSPQA